MTATLKQALVAGFDAVVLENSRVRAVVIPSLGGRVWELVDLARRRQWIWHRHDVVLAATAPGSSYDDVWAGGWEELFPNDARGPFEGRSLPDHGEWWTMSWRVAESRADGDAILRLEASTEVRRALCSKEFRLGADSASLDVTYRIVSHEDEPFHFLFKQHLPVAVTPSCELAMPGGRVTAVDAQFGTLMPGPGPHIWPIADADGRIVDLRHVPPRSSESREFVYCDQLGDGWCGVNDMEARASLRMQFDRAVMPFVWLFLAYGGWRGCYTAVLEPCTNMPKELAEATRLGQSARLAPGEAFETMVSVTLEGLPTES